MEYCLTPEQEERRKIVLAERLAKKRASNPHKDKQDDRTYEFCNRSDESPILVLPPRRTVCPRRRDGGPSMFSQVEEAAALVSAKGQPTAVEHVAVQLGASWKGTRQQLSRAIAVLRHRGRVAQLPPGYGHGRRKAKTAG